MALTSKSRFSQTLQEVLVVRQFTWLQKLLSSDRAWLRLDMQQLANELWMKDRDADWDEFRHGGAPVAFWLIDMAPPARLERATPGFVNQCSESTELRRQNCWKWVVPQEGFELSTPGSSGRRSTN